MYYKNWNLNLNIMIYYVDITHTLKSWNIYYQYYQFVMWLISWI